MTGPLALRAGRRAAEARMVDTCVIGTPVRGALDETTGQYAETITAVYSGRCEYRAGEQQVNDQQPEGQHVAVTGAVLKIPVTAAGSALVGKDHVAVITLAANDQAVVRARVQAGHAATYATARRLPVEVTT